MNGSGTWLKIYTQIFSYIKYKQIFSNNNYCLQITLMPLNFPTLLFTWSVVHLRRLLPRKNLNVERKITRRKSNTVHYQHLISKQKRGTKILCSPTMGWEDKGKCGEDLESIFIKLTQYIVATITGHSLRPSIRYRHFKAAKKYSCNWHQTSKQFKQ